MKYKTKTEIGKISIIPEDRENLINLGISFWEADINTKGNLNTVFYRFNVTALTTQQKWNQLSSFFDHIPDNWINVADMRNVDSLYYLENRAKVDRFFNQLFRMVGIQAREYEALECFIGTNDGMMINVDVKKESKLKLQMPNNSHQGTSFTAPQPKKYAACIFRIDFHIHSEINNTLKKDLTAFLPWFDVFHNPLHLKTNLNSFLPRLEPFQNDRRRLTDNLGDFIQIYAELMQEYSTQLRDLMQFVNNTLHNSNENNSAELAGPSF